MVTHITIDAAQGPCPAWIYRPEGHGTGPFPGVLVLMDGPGMRPAIQDLAARIAASGVIVLLPDLFYRAGDYAPINPAIVFADPVLRQIHIEQFMSKASAAAVMADLPAYIAALAAIEGVAAAPFGVVGYCMGGRLALIAAGTYPASFGLAASFHGGGLANDAPDSPHLLAEHMTARIYVGGAIEDAHFDDAEKARLETALTAAGVTHTVETWPARHGWCPSDMPVYDREQSDRHYAVLAQLFSETLAA